MSYSAVLNAPCPTAANFKYAGPYRDGYRRAAETVLEIADAAERELLERAHNP